MKLKTTLALLLLVGSGLALYLASPELPFLSWSNSTSVPQEARELRQRLRRMTPEAL